MWNLGDSLLLHELARAAVRQIPRFGPQALSNLAWAFARARHYDSPLVAALVRRARVLLGQFNPEELANLAWALITLRCRQSGLLTALAHHAAQHCSSWDSKACAKLATAYSSLPQPSEHQELFQAVADAFVARPSWLTQLTPHELAALAAAYATARIRHTALLGQIAAAAQQQVQRFALLDMVKEVQACALGDDWGASSAAAAVGKSYGLLGCHPVLQRPRYHPVDSPTSGTAVVRSQVQDG
eukprot:gene2443-2746_t